MASPGPQPQIYFVFSFPLSAEAWDRFRVASLLGGSAALDRAEFSYEIRKLAARTDAQAELHPGEKPVAAEILLALRTLNQALRHVAARYFTQDNPGSLERGRQWTSGRLGADSVQKLMQSFVELFPPAPVRLAGLSGEVFLADVAAPVSGLDRVTLEMLLLFLNLGNPAARPAAGLFDDEKLRQRASFVPFVTGFEEYMADHEAPGSEGMSIIHLLRSPLLASPDSLSGQLAYLRDNWSHLLPADLMQQLQVALDVLQEIDVARGGEPGPPPVLEFGPGRAGWRDGRPEPEAFSTDADWMSNVVLMAKSVFVWLDQLSRWHQRPIERLDQIPDIELDRLAGWGVNGLWLIGLWERSEASRKIKQYMGNPEAAASAYALRDYRIAPELGGEEAWRDLSERAGRRGIRLASDMVPNHMGIDSRWVIEHPEYFLQLDRPPYPAYSYTGSDLCDTPGVAVRIEDGYWHHSDAAVVFQRVDETSGDVRYIYHGNDGTSMPWNDTAQLDFLRPEVREAVIGVILDVARRFPIIRFDAAMTLAKKHFQRLWFPAPGDAGAIPSRAEHGLDRDAFDAAMPIEFWREVVDRVAAEAPGTLLLAEAFWLMEGYFVRTLGMHRVYNSAFMNMLKMEDNAKYRQTIKNVLEFSPEVLKRFVNFMNNPDERTAVEQFGRGDKYFGCMLLLVTMPGLPMLGHGQIEGFSEKYGMEFRKAYWDEPIDHGMVQRHEREIFPLMRRRHVFSGADHFALFDFESDGGWVDENVFAYTNRYGDEKALVIFNNAYDSTSGRLRLASAVNVGSADLPQLVRRSLSDALALDASPDVWHIFRDHREGLQYLRSGSEMDAQGLHLDLHGYQARALMDWRSVRDVDGQWARLAAHLQGGGVLDLDLARRRLLVGADLEHIRAWMSPAILAWIETGAAAGDLASPAAPESAPDVAPSVLEALPPELGDTARALHDLAARPFPTGLGERSAGDLRAVVDGLPGSCVLQALYLAAVLHRAEAEIVETEPAVGCLTDEDLPLVHEDMTTTLCEWSGNDYAAWHTTQLAAALAAGRGIVAEMARGRTAWLPRFLHQPAAAAATGINEHAGQTWITQEGLETLLAALVLAGWIEGPVSRLPALLDARAMILEAAAAAGYAMPVLSEALDPSGPEI